MFPTKDMKYWKRYFLNIFEKYFRFKDCMILIQSSMIDI